MEIIAKYCILLLYDISRVSGQFLPHFGSIPNPISQCVN
jgi:hypothetical protein